VEAGVGEVKGGKVDPHRWRKDVAYRGRGGKNQRGRVAPDSSSKSLSGIKNTNLSMVITDDGEGGLIKRLAGLVTRGRAARKTLARVSGGRSQGFRP